MPDQQVGDALVFTKRQAQGWFGMAAGLSVNTRMTINTISVSIYSINMAINPIRDGVPCKHNTFNKL